MVTNGKKIWVPQLEALWSATYGDSEEEIDLFFREFYNDKACWCYEVQGRPVSVIYGIPASMTVKKEVPPRPVWYLYAGATAAEFRSCGYYRQVMVQAVAELNRAGGQSPLVLLVPAAGLEGYYERIGFQTVLHEDSYYLTQEELGNMNPDAVNRLDASHYKQHRDRFFGGPGYVEWGEQFLAYAIGTVERASGAALEIRIKGRTHILLARPCEGSLKILETSMNEEELAGCGLAIARCFDCTSICREGITVMGADKPGIDRLYFRIALDS